LLAQRGLSVLVVDPMRRGSDTLSTHALMRGAVLQLARWGLLGAVRAAGTPTIRSTTFHYGGESITVPIKERDGVDGLYAPRRTVIDPILLDAAESAGAEVVLGRSVVDLLRDGDGRVRGATIAGTDGRDVEVTAGLVIGADGVRSRIAGLVGAPREQVATSTTASIYGYHRGLGVDASHWYFGIGASVGAIPTNEGYTCVFASLPSKLFESSLSKGLETVYRALLEQVSPEFAARVAESTASSRLRGFPGLPGFLRRSAGPGWALVGDAGYFKDPLTAHGITDALRDAELLARAVLAGGDDALARYQETRDGLVRGLFEVTDRIASFEWDLEQVKGLHLELSREMSAEVDFQQTLGETPMASPADREGNPAADGDASRAVA
ncbi:MAG TPA: NAD(P)/FAD-dependent oxidoreductase, partial [Gemmatimonadales bacterium]|nr:NAD(P)/FAD-dependent oxidoreductase [Gemmatimonadales bacterium]